MMAVSTETGVTGVMMAVSTETGATYEWQDLTYSPQRLRSRQTEVLAAVGDEMIDTE